MAIARLTSEPPSSVAPLSKICALLGVYSRHAMVDDFETDKKLT